ncbi:ArsR/SmtB family transcription factor [Myxococcota bacterium]
MMTQTNTRLCGPACCEPLDTLMSPEFFKALSDPNRVAILIRLAQSCSSQTVSEVAGCCPIDISVVSRHLALLKRTGILDAQRTGKEVRYSVRFDVLAATLRNIADAIEACCPPPESKRGKRSNP